MGLFLPGNDRRWASYDLEVAEKLGLNEAIVLAQIISSIEGHIDRHETDNFFRNGMWWMYDSAPDFSKKTALGVDIVRRVFSRLKKLKILQTAQYGRASGDCRYWYSINKITLAEVLSDPPLYAKPKQGASMQNPYRGVCKTHIPLYAKPQEGLYAKPTHLSITHNSIDQTIDHTITPPIASVTALPIKKPRSKKAPKLVSEPFLELGKKWLDFSQRKSKSSNPRWTAETFGEALEKTSNTAKISIERLTQALNYLEGDVFWTKFAHSPKTLLVISRTQDKYRILQILESMDEPATGTGGIRYERPKAIDYSADNGKFAKVNDKKPWES